MKKIKYNKKQMAPAFCGGVIVRRAFCMCVSPPVPS
jgi:hypothetical protein